MTQLACKAEWRRTGDAGNAIAVELLRPAADSLLHELAYVFTPHGHPRFPLMKQQCVAPVGKRTVSDEEIDVFAERLPKLTAPTAGLPEPLGRSVCAAMW